MKTKLLNSKQSISILKQLMFVMGYNKKEANRFIKKHKIGKEKIME
jgi:hypothetical protein